MGNSFYTFINGYYEGIAGSAFFANGLYIGVPTYPVEIEPGIFEFVYDPDGYYDPNTGNISGIISDITIGNIGYGFLCKGGDISGTITDISMTSVIDAFESFGYSGGGVNSAPLIINGNISGTISNIRIDNLYLYGFYSEYGNISATINNVTVISAITNFDIFDFDFRFLYASIVCPYGTISSKISYFKSNGPIRTTSFLMGSYGFGTFSGQLLDCEFDMREIDPTNILALSVIDNVGPTAIIERCKLLSNSGVNTIAASASNTPVQILYTVINNGTFNITATPSIDNYNIYTW
jgi:hypothetical protein